MSSGEVERSQLERVLEQALAPISNRLGHLEELAEAHEVLEEESLEVSTASLENRISFVQQWGWLGGVVALIFSSGVTYAMFLGENATDTEVRDEVTAGIKDHNGGLDPKETDPATGYPRGHHPDMREAIKSTSDAVEALTETQTAQGKIVEKLDKRGRYQFEYTKWEVHKAECKRERSCTWQDLKKPKALETLENELIND